MREHRATAHRACRLTGLSRSTWGYQLGSTEPEGLRQAIRDAAYAHPRLGYRFMHWSVLQLGFVVGQRRVRRLYRLAGRAHLNLIDFDHLAEGIDSTAAS